MGRHPNLARRKLIEKLAAKGWKQRQIAGHLGCSLQNVSRYLQGKNFQVHQDVVCCRCGATITVKPVFHFRRKPVLCLPCLEKKPDPSFQERLQSYRLAAELSRTELADRIGVNKACIARYEIGGSPGWQLLSLLVQELGPELLTHPPPKVRPRKKRVSERRKAKEESGRTVPAAPKP